MTNKGYTSKRLGLGPRVNELIALTAGHWNSPENRVRETTREANSALADIQAMLGNPSKALDILEIGSGQRSIQLAVMSKGNRAVGIDQESSGDSLNLKSVLETVKSDGIMRATKTVARKIMGFDRATWKEYVKQSGASSVPELNILKMNAAHMSFPNNSFDVVFSRAVFEHVENPEAVLKEVARVLRPKGVLYCLLHLYTSDSGCHDIRILLNRRGELPLWAHLRESHHQKVIENTFLNRLRLHEWRRIVEFTLPGAKVESMMDDDSSDHKSKLTQIREAGELINYSDEELLSVTVKVIWQRPPLKA